MSSTPPSLPGIDWGRRGGHTRPGNTSYQRDVAVVRGVLMDRLESVTARNDALTQVATSVGIRPDRVADLMYLLMILLFPEEMEYDAEVESGIEALRDTRREGLLPDGELERVGAERMRRFAESIRRVRAEG